MSKSGENNGNGALAGRLRREADGLRREAIRLIGKILRGQAQHGLPERLIIREVPKLLEKAFELDDESEQLLRRIASKSRGRFAS